MNYLQKWWLLVCFVSISYIQAQTITGNVTAASDKLPLAGASVFIPSKTITNQSNIDGLIESVGVGVITDFDGNFSLSLPKGTKQIAVSFIGFQTKIISISNKTHYVIVLEEETNTLQEVVVTGYQKIEKRKLTASIAKIESKDLQQAGVASIDQLLQGQVAGLVTTVETGSPGELSKIRIRGTASLDGPQDPLWVIDGLPLEGNEVPDLSEKSSIDELRSYSIAGLNPDDIQDITILRDVAATAIYGARAANGVIVITTKKGRKGSMKINISANTFVTQRPDFSKLNLMNSAEKVDFELAMASRNDLSFRTDKGEVYRILNNANEYNTYQSQGFNALSTNTQNAINSLKNQYTAWDKLLYRSTFNKQYTASFSGGGEKADYYFSLGYYNEEGTTIGTGFERYNVSLSNTYRFNDRFKTGISLLGSQTNRKSYVTDTGSFTNPSKYSRDANPYYIPLNNDLSYVYDQDIRGLDDIYLPFNFLEERSSTDYQLKNQAIKAIIDAEYKILKNLTFTSQLGIQLDADATEKTAQKETYFTRKYRANTRYWDSSSSSFKYFLPDGGIIQNWNTNFFQYNWKNNLQYTLELNNKHEIDLFAGVELRRNQSKTIHTKGFGYNDKNLTTKPLIFNPNSSEANSSMFKQYSKNEVENAFVSFYTTASYTYKHRYTLFGSLRYDGSNLFGVDPKYKYLPLWAVSGSWLISEENFLQGSTILPYLRLRASYGLQGNIDKNTYPYVVGTYDSTNILPNSPQTIITVTSPPNDKLRWEKTTNYNAGLDAGFFNNRIRLSGDIYSRISSDLIGQRALALENGFNYSSINWAEVSNKGFELTLTTHNVRKENFDWTTTISLAHNKSKVERMQVRDNERIPSREGLPVNAVFAFKTNGLDAEGLPIFIDKSGKDVSLVEFFKLYDPWASFFPGVMTATELKEPQIRELYTYVGDKDPKYSGGIINTFRYKDFDLSINANFNIKRTMVRNIPYDPSQVDKGFNYSRDILNAWTPDNTQTTMPRIIGENTFLNGSDSFMAYQWLSGTDATNGISTISRLDTWVQDISYMRITSIRLGYSLPKDVVKRIGFESFRFNIEGRNLFVFSTDYNGFFDPETFGNIYAQPIAKSITMGVNLTF
ncbi:SusC/RagA family TonB-linked outer membrane protein [Capnocytophaga catalasegens]|uniref:SusC/RagA family TonB-linked outer membrane protein n=1 Tax=Capnocytophaga catalasegens TaxID=1004260 RepID=A0AAV5APA8_9FLAO|nr:SusC/RagA family TonB-linked outer membrane protein [Capnocytophaga catalasegens]GIZ16338.1 SusC/RagA family TonB-linked outer membrane protein [Capnocytophaga catalasegens]GJM49136.1 SusC/RagA family TonB-linked outer membrane protein [Capnocytophaga catalasegens]GJM53680.1 SusC/RagA family TonB-linked outer membrane protein [Capnocytophaga catalasegens]